MKFCRFALVLVILTSFVGASGGDEEEETTVKRKLQAAGDPFFYTAGEVVSGGLAAALGYEGKPYTTQSFLRYLPAFDGHMQTTNTYRFISVREQIFTMIGEHKHGLWQVQESGFIREYLKANAIGLPNTATQENADLVVVMEGYAAYLPDQDEPYNWAGYTAPSDKINAMGNLQYIDLPISHPKYMGKYDEHPPIDLPLWYCTMSEPLAPNAARVLEYSYAQPGANVVGELGIRAGLDLNELYTNVIRLHTFPDARSWVNIAPTLVDTEAAEGRMGRVEYVAVDPSRIFTEYYLVERPFFNVKYYFIVAVYDDGLRKKGTHSYMRPEGAYYESLLARGYKESDFNTEVKPSLFYYTRNSRMTGRDGAFTETKIEEPAAARGQQLYGGHGLNRAVSNKLTHCLSVLIARDSTHSTQYTFIGFFRWWWCLPQPRWRLGQLPASGGRLRMAYAVPGSDAPLRCHCFGYEVICQPNEQPVQRCYARSAQLGP